jgi:hypothetical protein
MASKRNRNSFNPLDLNPDVGVGVTLPFGKENGLFNQSFTTEEQANSNLKLLLLTIKGERPYQPNFGSSLHALLFQPMNTDLQTLVEDSLREDIGFWLPYIVIDKVESELDFDRHTLRVLLSYRITPQNANQEVVIFVDPAGTEVVDTAVGTGNFGNVEPGSFSGGY